MDLFKKVGQWADELTKIGMSIVALGVVGILGGLSNEGLLGLVGAMVLYYIFKKD